MNYGTPQLLTYVQSQSSPLFARLQQLSERVALWLRYTVTLFPHYTSHAVDHSERIIHALSLLLFDDSGQPRLTLSAMEAYILCAAAYLHDSGMVVSESEQQETLGSNDWKSWLSQGPYKDVLARIETYRADDKEGDQALRNFNAARELRYIMAEILPATTPSARKVDD